MALNDFGGGMITFSTTASLHTKWPLRSGLWTRVICVMGVIDVVGEDVQLAGAAGGNDDVFDGAGNNIEVNINVSLSDTDKEKNIKALGKIFVRS